MYFCNGLPFTVLTPHTSFIIVSVSDAYTITNTDPMLPKMANTDISIWYQCIPNSNKYTLLSYSSCATVEDFPVMFFYIIQTLAEWVQIDREIGRYILANAFAFSLFSWLKLDKNFWQIDTDSPNLPNFLLIAVIQCDG